MTQFYSRLKPIVGAVAIGSAMLFLSSQAAAALAGGRPEITKLNATLDQNQGGVVEGKRNRPDWASRINVSGLINVDATIQNRTPTLERQPDSDSPRFFNWDVVYFGHRGYANDIALADADLFVDATVNPWVNTHIALLYRDNHALSAIRQFRKGNLFNPEDLTEFVGNFKLPSNDPDLSGTSLDDDIYVDEAYFTIGNFERCPYYLRAGRLYVPFGSYQRYSVSDSLTKLLSMTSSTVVQVGAVFDDGWSGSLYTFRGISNDNHEHFHTDGHVRVRNWGGQVAYARDMGDMTYNVGLGYLHNMADVDFLRAGLLRHNEDAVPALSLHGDVVYGPFDFGFRYVTALEEFDPVDIEFEDDGAKPRAFSLDAGYRFKTMHHHSRVAITYQHSDDAVELGPYCVGLPEHRWGIDYQINLLNRTDLDFELIRDTDYGREDGGTGSHITVGTVRLSVAFA